MPEMSPPPERPNRDAIHAGCVAVTKASAKALSDFCPIPVEVPSEAPGSAGGNEALRRVRRDDILNLPSVGEGYALLVLGFQIGFAVDLLGFQQVERVEAGVIAPANAGVTSGSKCVRTFLMCSWNAPTRSSQRVGRPAAYRNLSTCSGQLI